MSQTQGLIAIPQDNRHIHLYDINGVRYGRPTKMSKVTHSKDSSFTDVIVGDNNVIIMCTFLSHHKVLVMVIMMPL